MSKSSGSTRATAARMGGSANTQSATVAQAQAALNAKRVEWAEVRRTWDKAISNARDAREQAYEQRSQLMREIMRNGNYSSEDMQNQVIAADKMVEAAEQRYRETIKGESRMEEERSRDLDKYAKALYEARNKK